MIDELSHLANQTGVRGQYIPKEQALRYAELSTKVAAGGTKALSLEENIVFHKLELANMVNWLKAATAGGNTGLPKCLVDEMANITTYCGGYWLP